MYGGQSGEFVCGYWGLRNFSSLFTVVSEGKKHDAGMLRDSGLLADLENHAFSPLCLYGDPAYPLRVHLQAPFGDARLTPDMEAFNQSMSRVSVC